MPSDTAVARIDLAQLAQRIRRWGRELGFRKVGITGVRLDADEAHLLDWLGRNFHGDMDYMQRHGTRRSRPPALVPGTVRVISVCMDYWPDRARPAQAVLDDPQQAYLSRYALGRDYHKLMRNRLQKLASRIERETGPFGYRAFSDSAPVLEKALAQQAGLGWIGKHTNLIDEHNGSWFFLGELYTDLPLPVDEPARDHCGTCRACIDACPTGAIVGERRLDARLCISYLTIELHGAIPKELRPLIGNRIYGCDDCQLVCPWNRFAKPTAQDDFQPRHDLDDSTLVELFGWSEQTFLERTEGSAIRRIGHQRWLRNLAVALGNAPTSAAVVEALRQRLTHPSELVREHVHWALERHEAAPGAVLGGGCRKT